ncbi:MAG: peptidylprolyl isomerase [Deltaproteobacteria bacterium]|nr:peptidylprolyl isomerase [Deltaproteobacteria bacterium]
MRTFRGWIFLCIAVMAAAGVACDISESPVMPVAMTIGKRNVPVDVLKRDLNLLRIDMGIPDRDVGEALEPLLDRMVDRYLILEYGRDRGIFLSDDELNGTIQEIQSEYQEEDFRDMLLREYMAFDEWKGALRERLLIRKITESVSEDAGPVTFKEMKVYYDRHQEEFYYPRMVQFRQIVTSTRGDAEKLLGRLKQGEDFGELARKYSVAPESESGGEVGWIRENDLEESMGKVLFSLSPDGGVSIVETPYGFHILDVMSRRPAGRKTLPEAMVEIERRLTYEKENSFYRHWLNQLRNHYPVKINRALVDEMELG